MAGAHRRCAAQSGTISQPDLGFEGTTYMICPNCATEDRAMLAGDYAVATEEAILAAGSSDLASLFLIQAFRAAMWAGDLARARETQLALEADRYTGPIVSADRVAARVGVAAAAEGRLDEAGAGYRDAIARGRAISSDLSAARFALDLVRFVGGQDAAARDAATEARVIFARIKAQPSLDLLHAAAAGKGIDARPTVCQYFATPSGTHGAS